MSESLLDIRHPYLARLHTIWRLVSNDDQTRVVDADLLGVFKDNLITFERDDIKQRTHRVHVGASLSQELVADATVATAMDVVWRSQQPMTLEWTSGRNTRHTALLLPFGRQEDGTSQVVAAIYPTEA